MQQYGEISRSMLTKLKPGTWPAWNSTSTVDVTVGAEIVPKDGARASRVMMSLAERWTPRHDRLRRGVHEPDKRWFNMGQPWPHAKRWLSLGRSLDATTVPRSGFEVRGSDASHVRPCIGRCHTQWISLRDWQAGSNVVSLDIRTKSALWDALSSGETRFDSSGPRQRPSRRCRSRLTTKPRVERCSELRRLLTRAKRRDGGRGIFAASRRFARPRRKTHIASIGTALLARRRTPRTDAHSLHVKAGTPGALRKKPREGRSRMGLEGVARAPRRHRSGAAEQPAILSQRRGEQADERQGQRQGGPQPGV